MSLMPKTLTRKTLGLFVLGAALAFVSWGCRSAVENHESAIRNTPPLLSPSTQQETRKKSWESIYFDDINQRSAAAGLTKLREAEGSADSLEIRIWAGLDMASLRGVVLRRTHGQWTAVYVPPAKTSQASAKLPIVLSPPKSGWDSFWGTLSRLDILTLPDAVDVGADNVYPDALGVVIEIKSSGSYRTYNYNGFETSERVEAKKVQEICKVLSEEFKIFLC